MFTQKDLLAYDERYKKVYEAEGIFWNKHVPHQTLLEFAAKLPKGSTCIDCGCGEGHEARALANLGHRVMGIDLSPTVIERNKKMTPHLAIEFLVGDVTDLKSLGIEDAVFDLALDIGCLHMMNATIDRISHLKEIKRVLKPGGFLYLQNGLRPNDGPGHIRASNEKEIFSTYNQEQRKARKIITHQGEKELLLPVLPCKLLSLGEYISELTGIGFSILFSERGGGANMDFEAVIIAKA